MLEIGKFYLEKLPIVKIREIESQIIIAIRRWKTGQMDKREYQVNIYKHRKHTPLWEG